MKNIRARLVRLAFLAGVLAAFIGVTSARGTAKTCSYGVSSVGRVVLVNGQLVLDQSDLTPDTQARLQQ